MRVDREVFAVVMNADNAESFYLCQSPDDVVTALEELDAQGATPAVFTRSVIMTRTAVDEAGSVTNIAPRNVHGTLVQSRTIHGGVRIG